MQRSALLSLAFVVFVSAGPLNTPISKCAHSCPESSGLRKHAYEIGRRYVFKYETSSQTTVRGAAQDTAGTHLYAKVALEPQSNCEMALTVLEVNLREYVAGGSSPQQLRTSPAEERVRNALMSHDLHFTWGDGKIEELCANAEESEWVLNMKRGMISTLQNTMPSLSKDSHSANERDVSGNCPVTYNKILKWNTVEITKTHMMESCTERQSARSALQATGYHTPAQLKSLPVTRGERKCVTQLFQASGVAKTIRCSEEIIFRPFSQDQAGAVTTIAAELTFLEEDTAQMKLSHDHVFRRTTLLYEHSRDTSSAIRDDADVVRALQDLCVQAEFGVAKQTPRLFTELVYRMRKIDLDTLRILQRKVNAKTVCQENGIIAKRFFHDALPMLGNAHSMAILKDLVINNQISDADADTWLTSLAFQQHPAKEMLIHLRPLIEQTQPRKQALLGVSALVSQYCQDRTNCHEEEEVKAIARALERLVQKCDATSIAEKRLVIVTLKAISNAGAMPHLAPVLLQCATGAQHAMEVKIAAVEAFRRMGCTSNVDRSGLEKMFMNLELDSELRIAAYLAMMVCPTTTTLATVKNTLAAEKVNQVGSFVWTHLTNLAETSDPHKQSIRTLLEDAALKKQFNINKLKYSRNVEKSVFFNSLNTGAKMESNLVWSQKSFLPRSATLNMTMDLFGKSFNFLELGGRVQGLESLLEKYLGPDSKSKEENSKNSIDQLKQLDETFKQMEEEIGGALNIKIFGHQIAYMDLWKSELSKNGFNFLQFLQSLRDSHSFEWHKTFMFLDTEYTLPTISGLPLKLNLNGTASVSLKMSGKLDMLKLMQWPSVFDVQARLVPSAAVELSGMMSVEMPTTGLYGVKMVSIAHTSTELDGQISMNHEYKFKANLKMPSNKQELLGVSTQFFIVQQGSEREQKMLGGQALRQFGSCTGTTLERVLGVQLCGSLSYPVSTGIKGAPMALFAGPISANVNLFKRDTHAEYVVEGSFQNGGKEMRLLIDTPSSKVERRLLAEFKLDQESRAIMMQLSTPWKKFSFNGALSNTASLKRAQLKFFMDGFHLFNLLLENKLAVTESKMITMTPKIEIQIPGIQPITAKAAITHGKDFGAVEATFVNILRSPVKMLGNFKRFAALNRYQGELSIASHFFNGHIAGNFQLLQGLTVLRSSVNYKILNGQNESLTFYHKTKDSGSGNMIRLTSHTRTTISMFPKANAEVNTELQMRKDMKYMKTKLTAEWGHETRDTAHFESYYDYVTRDTKRTFLGTAKLVIPSLRLDNSIKVDSAFDQHVITGTCILSMHEKKHVVLNAHFQRSLTGLLKLSGQISGRVQKHLIQWSGEVEQTSELRIFALKSKLNYLGRQYAIVGNTQIGHYEHSLNATFTASGMTPSNFFIQLDVNPQQPKLKVALNAIGQPYSLDVQYKLLKDDRSSLSFSCFLKHPRRSVRITGSSQMDGDERTAQFKVMWDAERDATRAIDINMSFNKPNSNGITDLKMNLQINSPWRNINTNFKMAHEFLRHNSAFELEYSTGKKIGIIMQYDINDGWTEKGIIGMIRVTTPFVRYETVELKIDGYGSLRTRKLVVDYNANGRRFKTDIDITLGNINNFVAKIIMITPWTHASYMQFHLKHLLTTHEIDSILNAEFKTKKVSLIVRANDNGDFSRRDFAFNVEFKSPFNHYKEIRWTGTHKDDGIQYTTETTFKWAPTSEIGGSLNYNWHRNGLQVNSNGNALITTPFINYKRISATWNHENTNTLFKTTTKVNYYPEKWIELAINGLNELTVQGSRNIHGKMLFSTPSDKLSIELIQGISKQGFTTKIEFVMPEEQRYITEAAAIIRDGLWSFNTKLNIPQNEAIGAKAEVNFDRVPYLVSGTIFWSPTQSITLQGKLSPTEDRRFFEISSSIDTPFKSIPHVSFIHRQFMHSSSSFKSYSEVEYFPGQKFTLMGELGFTNGMKLEGKFSTPFATPREITIGIEQSALGNWFEFSNKHWFNYNDEVVINGELSMSGLRNIAADWKLITQQGTRSLRLTQNINNQQHIHQVVLEYSAGQKIEVSSKLSYTENNGFKVEFNQRTPMEIARSSDLIFSFTPGQNKLQFSTAASFKHVFNDQLLDLEAFVQLDTKKIKCTARLNTPWSSQMSLSLKHERMTSGEWVGQAELNLPSGRIDLETGFSLGSINSLTCRFNLRTPFSFLQQLSGSVQHNGVANKFENSHKFSILANGQKLVMTNKINLLGSRFVSIDSNLDSNIPGVEKINFKLSHKLGVGMYSGYLRTEYGANAVEAKSQISRSNRDILMKFELKTPSSYLKNIVFELEHSVTSATYFTNLVKINFVNDMTKASFKERIQVRSLRFITFTSKLRLPLPGYEIIDINLENNIMRTTYKTNAVVILGTAQYKWTSQMELKNGLLGLIELITPIEGYRNIKVQLQHTGSYLDFVNKLTIQYPERETLIENELIWNAKDEKRATWNFRSPFKNAERLSASASVQGTARNFEANFEFSGSSDHLRKFTGTMAVNLENEVKINTKLQTPIQGFEMITLTLLHSGTFERRVNSQFALEMPIMVTKLSFLYNLEADALTVNMEATAPKMGKMLSTMKMTKNQFQISFELPKHLDSKWAMTANWRISRPIQMSLNIETHIDGYNRMSFNLRETVGQVSLNAHVPAWGKELTCIGSYKQTETNSHKVSFSMDGPFLTSEIQFHTEVKLNYPLLSGKLSFTSPLGPFNQLEYEFKLNHFGGVFFEFSDKAVMPLIGNFETKTRFALENNNYELALSVKVNMEEQINLVSSANINNINLKVESVLLTKPIIAKIDIQRKLLALFVDSQWQVRPFNLKISLNGKIDSQLDLKVEMSACFISEPVQIEFKKSGNDNTAFVASLQAKSQWQSTPLNVKLTFENRAELLISAELSSHFQSTPIVFRIQHNADLMSYNKFCNTMIFFNAPFITKSITFSSNFKLTSNEMTFKGAADSQWYVLSNFMVNFNIRSIDRMVVQNTLILEHSLLESPIEVTLKLNIPSDEKVSLSIKTPFNNAWKNVEFLLRSKIDESVSIQSHVKYFPNEIVDLKMKFTYVGSTNFKGKVSLNNPMGPLEMAISHLGELNNFENEISINQHFQYKGKFRLESQSMKCNFGVQIPMLFYSKPINLEIVSDARLTSESVEGSVRVDLPFLEKASLKLKHNGLASFTNELVIMSRFHTPIQFKGMFAMEETKRGEFELTAPYLDTAKLSFRHHGGEKFVQEMMLSTKFFTTIRYTANFNEHEGTFSLENPLTLPLSSEFRFDNSQNKILQIMLKKNGEELFAFDGKTNSLAESETFTSNLKIRAVKMGEHQMKVKLSTGTWRKVMHSVEVQSTLLVGPLAYKGKWNSFEGNVDADFTLTTPFANFETNQFTLKWIEPKELQITVQNSLIELNSIKVMLDGGMGSIDFVMPKVPYFTSNKLTFNVTPNRYNINLNNAETGSYIFDGFFTTQTSAFDASFEVTTPWSSARQSKFTFTSQYTYEEFQFLNYNFQSKFTNNYVGEVELNVVGKSDITKGESNSLIELKTPFEKAIYTRYSTKSSMRKLNGKVTAESEKIFENTHLGKTIINSKEIMSFDSTSKNFDVKVTYKVKTPQGNNVFDSNIILNNRDYYHKFEITSDFISAPILNEVAVSLKNDQNQFVINLNGPIIGINQVAIKQLSMQLNLVFSTSYFGYFGATGSLDYGKFTASLVTPFEMARTNSLTVQWQPSIDIILHLSAMGKIRLTSDYTMSKSIKAFNVRLDTPISYLESTALHFHHRGINLKDFTTKFIFDSHMLGKTEFVAGFECTSWPQLAGGTFVLKTPIEHLNDFQLHVTQEIKNKVIMHLGEVKIPTHGAYRVQTRFIPNSELDVTITTPLSYFSEARIATKHLTNLAERKLNEQVTISWNGNSKWEAILIGTYSDQEKNAKLLLTNGNEKFGFEIIANGLQTDNFNSKIQLWTPKGDILAQGVFVINNGIHIRATLMTPWTPKFDTAFQSVGTVKNMKIELTAEWKTERYSIGTTYDVTKGYHMSAHMDIPFNDLMGQKVSFELTPTENSILLVANVDCKLGKAIINIFANKPTGHDIKLSVTYNHKVYIIELRNLQENSIRTHAIRLVSPTGQLVHVKHTLNRQSYGDDRKFQMDHALGQYFQNVKMHLNVERHQRNGVIKVNADFESKETGLWSLQMLADHQPNNINGQFTMHTPITTYSKLDGSFLVHFASSIISTRVDLSSPQGMIHFHMNSNLYNKLEADLQTPWSMANTKIRAHSVNTGKETTAFVRFDNAHLGVYQFVANKIKSNHESETTVKMEIPNSKTIELRYKITGKLPGSGKIEGYLHIPSMDAIAGKFEINYISIENVEGDLKLQLPGIGDITGSMKLSKYNSKISIQLPQDKIYELNTEFESANKKISIEIITPLPQLNNIKIVIDRVSITKSNGDLVFTITLPNNNAITGTLQYTKTPNVSFNVRLRTPYSQLNHLNANGEIKTSGGHFSVEMAPGEVYKINVKHDVSASNLLGNVQLTTPYRQMELNLNHRNSGRHITIHHEVNLGEGKLFFVKGQFAPSTDGFQTKLNFATPFEGFRNGKIEMEQTHGVQHVQFKHSLVYDEVKKLGWSGNLAGHIKNFNGRFQLETPFNQLQTAQLELQHKTQDEEIEFSHRLNYNNLHDIHLRGKVQRLNNEVRGQVDLSTPHPQYRELKLNIEHTHHSNQHFQFKHTVQLNGQQHCQFVGAYQRQQGNLNANLEASTSFPFLRNGLVSLKHSMDTPSKASFEHQLVYNNQPSMSLNGNWHVQQGTFKAAARASAGTQFTAFNLHHQHSNAGRQGSFHHRVESSGVYNFDGAGKWHVSRGKLSGDVQIVHPFSIIGPIKINVLHNHVNWRKFNCDHTLSYQNGKEYHMKGSLDGDNQEHRGFFLLSTPHPNLPELSLELNHNHASWKNFNFHHKLHHSGVVRSLNGKWQLVNNNKGVGKLHYNSPSRQIDVNVNHEHQDWSNFRFQHSLTHNKEKMLSAEGDFNLQKNHVVSFFQVDLPQKSVRYTINHNQPSWQETNFIHEFYLNGEKIIDGSGTWKLSRNQISANILLKTTFDQAPLVHIELHHEHKDWRQFNFRHRLTYSLSRVILLAGKFHQEGLLTKLDLRINTPCQYLSAFHFNFKHHGSLRNFRHESTCVYGKGNKISFIGSLNTMEKLSARATINLPFGAMHTIDAEINHEGSINQFLNSANIKINNVSFIHYSGKTEFTNARIYNINFALRSSCALLRHIGLRVVGDLQENGIKVEWNESKFFQIISHRGTQSDFQVRSSFPLLRHAAMSISHLGSRRHFTTEIKANYLRYSTSCKLEFRAGAKHQIKLILKTPFYPIRQVDVKFGLKSDAMHHLSAETILELNGVHKYSSSIIFSMPNTRNFETSWSIFTPIIGFEKVRVHFSHNGDLNQFVTKMSASLSKSTFGLGLSRDEMQNLNLLMETPITGFETVRLTAKGIRINEKVGTELLLSLPFEREIKAIWAGDIQFRGLRSSAEITFQLNTPFSDLNNLYVNLNHECDTTFTHKTVITINNIRYVNLDFTYDSSKGVMNLRKPRELTISYNLQRNPKLKSGHIKIASGSTTHLEVRFENEASSTEFAKERKLKANIVTPYRTMALESNSRFSPAKCQHEMSVRLNADSQPSRMKLVIEDKSRANQQIKEIELLFSSPVRELKAFVRAQKDDVGAKSEVEFSWDAARQPNKKITIEIFGKKIPGHLQIGATVKHPKFNRPLATSMTFNINRENKIFESFIIIDVLPESDNKIMSQFAVKSEGSNTVIEALLRQEGSHLNTGIASSFGQNSGVLQFNVKGHYKTSDARVLEMTSSLYVDSSARSCGFNYKMPTSEIHFTANWTPKSANIQIKNGENKEVKIFLEYLATKPAFNVRVFYNPSQPTDFVQINAGYKTDRHLQLLAFRDVNGKRIGDYQADLELSSDRLIQSRLHWRPTAHLEIKEWTKLTIHHTRASINQQWNAFTTFLNTEQNSKVQQLLNTLPRTEPMVAYLREEIVSFNRDFIEVTEEFNRMYARNEFFLKDLHVVTKMAHNLASQIARRVASRVMLVVANQLEVIHSVMSHVASFTYQLAASTIRIVYDACGIMCDMVPDVYNEIRSYILRKMNLYGQHINSIVLNQMNQFIERLSPSLDRVYKSFQRFEFFVTYQMKKKLRNLLENSAIIEMHRRVARSVDAVQSLPYAALFSHLHEGLHGKLLALHTNIQQNIEVIANSAQNVVDSAKVKLNNRLANLMENQHARLAGSLFSGAYEHAKWAIDHFELEDKLKNFARTNYLQTVNYLQENSIDLAKNYLKLHKNRITVYEPNNGQIEGQIYTPMRWNNLKSKPSLDFGPLQRRAVELKDRVRQYVSQGRSRLLALKDSIEDSLPEFNTPKIQFRGYATLAGRHVVTFDQHHFDFQGTCSYLLARDFLRLKWAVTAQYQDDKKSITVHAYNKIITIQPDNKVTIDGVFVELPFKHENLTVIKYVDTIKVIDTSLQIKLIIDQVNDVHTLSVSGWYHNRLGGLFGNFNNEPVDDVGEMEISQFAKVWILPGECQHNNVVPQDSSVPSEAAKRLCNEIFTKSHSSMRRCFKSVDPTIYLNMCTTDVDTRETIQLQQNRVCNSANLYSKACGREGVAVRPPTHCRRCSVMNLQEGETRRMEYSAPQAADVVFVIEEKACIDRRILERLPRMVQEIQQAFVARGVNEDNIRFGLIGFGSKQHTNYRWGHSHTLQGQLFGKVAEMETALQSVHLDSTGESSADALGAVRYALRYPFKAGASRHLVLLSCNTCQTSTSNSIYDISNLLEVSNIQLHVLGQHTLKVNTQKAEWSHRRIQAQFGFDSENSYNTERMNGDDEILSAVSKPSNDVCVYLAIRTGGAFFDRQQLRINHVARQDLFLKSFALRTVEKSRFPRVEECRCVAGQRRCHLQCQSLEMFPTTNISEKRKLVKREVPTDDFNMALQEYLRQ